MSRVHDALRKAAQDKPEFPRSSARVPAPPHTPVPPTSALFPAAVSPVNDFTRAAAERAASDHTENARSQTAVLADASADVDALEEIIQNARRIPYTPLKEALLVDPTNPREAPAEEFRSLRTRLNHMQTLHPLHTIVVTSASPAEGKSFTATNLAVTQAQLADKRVLLVDFDFRRPSVDKTFQIPCAPGMTDYLLGKARLGDIIRRVGDSQLYVITAGEAVINPLELLNLKECKALIDGLRDHFDWVILDSPPLLFAADGSLLATMCDGTILVVRIGSTTFDSVTRAIQSLCENNVLGVVVNGARRGELYSKYTYYHDYYTPPSAEEPTGSEAETETVEVGAAPSHTA